MIRSHVSIRDSLVVVLTLTTGAVDVTSFLALGNVFSSVVTGDLVLLGAAAGTGRPELAVHSGVALAGYLAGVMAGFADKLARQEAHSRSEGLVWVKDGDLATYFRRRHPYVRHVRHSGQRRTEAFAHGREAGRRIVLHKPVQASAESRGKLLPRKS